MKRAVRRAVNKRRTPFWFVVSGVMGGATAMLQFVPASWPTWATAVATLLAFAALGLSRFIEPDDDD